MKETPERQLLINYLLGICTPNELDYIERWLDEKPENVLLLQEILKDLNGKESPRIDKQKIKRELMDEVGTNFFNFDHYLPFMSNISGRRKTKPAKKSFLYRQELRIKAATMAVVIITTVALNLHYQDMQSSIPVVPEISLQQRTLSHGQTATLRFSDGSVIKVNGGSTLRYPQRFEKNKREVYLEGEAFFDIAPDKNRPFLVHVRNTTTRVLGTSFNIKAYENEEEIEVAVVEGKVTVSQSIPEIEFAESNEQVILERNQWATYLDSGQLLEKNEGDIWERVAWKDQVLLFNEKPFDEVARMLERWYGVEIILKGEELKHTVLKGEHKDVSLEQVLQSIQFILGIEFSIEEDVVTIEASEK